MSYEINQFFVEEVYFISDIDENVVDFDFNQLQY